MERLRPRERLAFSGFTSAEEEKMEKLEKESRDRLLDREFCRKVALNFNRSAGRAGKPAVKWTEVQNWFQSRQHDLQKGYNNVSERPNASPINKTNENFPILEGEKISNISELEFEAVFKRWRMEVRARFVGFGAEEDEWINVKNAVRARSFPLEHSACDLVKVGDLVLCFQERGDQAIYFDAHVMDIQRRVHDPRISVGVSSGSGTTTTTLRKELD